MDERTGRDAARTASRGRRTGRLARSAAALLAGGLLTAVSASPALAERGTLLAAAPEYPATVEITTVSPQVATDTSTVTITGKVANTGSSTLKSPTVAVRAPMQVKPLGTRSEIGLVASRTTPSGQDGIDLQNPVQDVGDLPPGKSADFTLSVPVSALKAKDTGAYELAVDVWGTTGSEKGHPLGIARTFLPVQGKATAKASQISVVWPLTHAPVLVAQTMPDNDQMPVLRDDSLAGELTGDGRLNQLVDIGGTMTGLTWAIDPDLLDTVYAMTKPYRVQKPGTSGESAREENTVPGTGHDAAVAWLAKLRQAVGKAETEVVSLPYADPDLASIAHHGTDQSGMDTALRKAVTAGQVTTEARLSVDAHSEVAWPYQGWLDQKTAAVAGASGGRVVLVNGASMPESEKLSYTPNAARPIGNGQTAVVADATLSELFQGDLGTPRDRTAAEQRFLAETLAIAHQAPEQPRTVLVLPPRSLTTGTATALRDSMAQAVAGGWAGAAVLDRVVGTQPDASANGAVPDGYPRELAASELSSDELAATMQLQNGVDQLMMILTQPQRVRGPFSAAMVRSLSTEWRDQPKVGTDYRTGVRQYLDNLKAAVRVPTKSVVTLPGDNATLLISVKNDLTQAVGNLELRLVSTQPNRLNVGAPQPVVLDATTARTFRFPAEAQVNGPVQVTAELWTTGPDAQRYGEPVTFTVEVTSVASGVTYVIVCGTVLMALAGVRFYLQRKKRKAAGEADEDPDRPLEGDGEAPEGPDADAEPSSDAGADDRVPGDEKVGH